jgi:gamma-glutamyltranspeptidase/glutathione hydrolase
MVSSTHWLASAVGMRMLERGGNAFDAAVAAGFVMQIVEPHMNGPGGDLPAIFLTADSKVPVVLCAQGTAPSALSIEALAELGCDEVPGNGLLPLVVPGAFGGWMELLRDYGTTRVRDILEPAVYYAEHGFTVLPEFQRETEAWRALFEAEWPSSAEIWLRGDGPRAGELFRMPATAATYRRIIEEAEARGANREAQIEGARRAFYEGFVAQAIDDFVPRVSVMDTSGRRNTGCLRGEDLARWQPSYEEPVSYDYQGTTVYKAGPWAQSPVFLQQLALLRGFDLNAMGVGSAEYIHTIVECAKLAFADRDLWYGDPNFVDVPVAALLSEQYNAERRTLVADSASYELRPGIPEGRQPPEMPPGLENPSSRPPDVDQERDTCMVCATDRFGNMIAAMPSGGWLQSSPVIPALGFPLTTRGQMFTLKPGTANALQPLKRPRTTLSPSLATANDEELMAFGSPGGDQQDQWAIAFLLSFIHHDARNAQEAIDEPRFHTSHFPLSFYPHYADLGRIHVEDRLPRGVIAELRERGHDVNVLASWAVGKLLSVRRRADGVLMAAADPRHMARYAAGR